MVKTLPANEGDSRVSSSIPVLGRSSGVGNCNPFQHSCLGNHMDRGAWWATIHGVTKNQTWLSTCAHPSTHIHPDLTAYFCFSRRLWFHHSDKCLLLLWILWYDAFKSKQHVQNSLHIFPYLLPFHVCLPVCSLICLFIPLFIVVFIEYFLCIKSCCCMHISENSWQVQSSEEIFRESGDLHAAYKLAVWDGMRCAKSWCYWDRIKEQREHPILTWVSGKAS